MLLSTVSLLAFVLSVPLVVADPDEPVDYSSRNFTSEDFVYRNVNSPAKATFNSSGGSQHQAQVMQFPALKGLGTGLTLLNFSSCGVNTPHVHPRATEFIYIFKGNMIVAFVDTNSTIRLNKVKAGDVAVIPRGMLHFEQNIGRPDLIASAFFDSQLPGTVGINAGINALPLRVQAASFNVYDDSKLRKVFDKTRDLGNITPDPICLKYLKKNKKKLVFDYSTHYK